MPPSMSTIPHPDPSDYTMHSTISSTATVAGKKHSCTPPPPPILVRSMRRPTPAGSSTRLSTTSSQPTQPSSSLATIKISQQQLDQAQARTQADSRLHLQQQIQSQRQQQPPQQQEQKGYQRGGGGGGVQQNRRAVVDDIDYEASNVCEIIKDRLYFMWTGVNPISTRRTTYLTVDEYLQYAAFFSDFGPFDIADVFRFCCLLRERLELARLHGKVLCLFTRPEEIKRANAAFALCCFMMLLHDQTPEQAFAPIRNVRPAFTPFRDAGFGPSTYSLTILDCLRGLKKGLDLGLLRLDRFDVKEYEHYERVSNGDFNWITPHFIAFAGPTDKLTFADYKAARAQRKARTGSSSGSSVASSSSSSGGSSVESSKVSSRSVTPSSIHSSRRSSRVSTPSSQSAGCSEREDSLLSNFRASSLMHTTGVSNKDNTTGEDHTQDTMSKFSGGGDDDDDDGGGGGDDPRDDTKVKSKKKKQGRVHLSKRFLSVLDYFEKKAHVRAVIRLNDKVYDAGHFQARKIEHLDMIYPDGTCPPWWIVRHFLAVCEDIIGEDPSHEDEQVSSTASAGVPAAGEERRRGVVAVHCKAGLGRTGTLIAVYLMKTYGMRAREVIAYLRLMRPGSVVGPQQNWLEENEERILSWYQNAQDLKTERLLVRREDHGEMRAEKEEKEQEREEKEEVEGAGVLLSLSGSGSNNLATATKTTLTAGSSPATDYEQVFSRANSTGLESTWGTEMDSDEEDEDEEIEEEEEVEEEVLSGGFRSGSMVLVEMDQDGEEYGTQEESSCASQDEDESDGGLMVRAYSSSSSSSSSSLDLYSNDGGHGDQQPQTASMTLVQPLPGPSPLQLRHSRKLSSSSPPSSFSSPSSYSTIAHHPLMVVTNAQPAPDLPAPISPLERMVVQEEHQPDNNNNNTNPSQQDQGQGGLLSSQQVGHREYMIPVQPRKHHHRHHHHHLKAQVLDDDEEEDKDMRMDLGQQEGPSDTKTSPSSLSCSSTAAAVGTSRRGQRAGSAELGR